MPLSMSRDSAAAIITRRDASIVWEKSLRERTSSISASNGGPSETHDRPSLKSQIERVRQEIQEHGESTVGCEELRVLCLDEVPPSSQWNAIARIAKSEGWSFAFFPNGGVQFAKL
jgi:hypothetical protein